MKPGRVAVEAVRALPLMANILAWLGVVIIAYGKVVVLTGEPWRPLERHILPVAATLTWSRFFYTPLWFTCRCRRVPPAGQAVTRWRPRSSCSASVAFF